MTKPGHKNEARDEAGVTATLREQSTGDCITVTVPGYAFSALHEIAHICDTREGEWRVICMSTPRTILRDLKYSRNYASGTVIDHRVPSTHYPEVTLLGRIGRSDLLDPSLVR